MKDILYILCMLAVTAVVLWIGQLVFNAVMGSDLPDYWKYLLLR